MSVDDLVKLMDAITRLVSTLVWPALVAYVLVRFAPSLESFFASLGEFTLKAAGFEASAKRQTQAAAALAAATTAKAEPGAMPHATDRMARDAADVVAQAVTPSVLRQAARATLLWVDDHPENDVLERRSLEALGAKFVVVTTTDEALAQVKARRFDAIVSDMNRGTDTSAAFTLLERLRASGDRTPFVIYGAKGTPEVSAEARRRGALGATDRAADLFQAVVGALCPEQVGRGGPAIQTP